MASPGRYVKKQLSPGGHNASVLSLVIICLGAGTLSIPFLFYMNGIVFGTILLAFGGYMSYFTGYLIAICSDKIGAVRYEDIAMATYGKKASRLTSFSMLACLLGFTISYVILVKTLLPFTLGRLTRQHKESIPR
jgi:amino acid permease